MNKSQKWLLFIAISLVFLILTYIFVWRDKDESFFQRVINPVVWIFLFYHWIFIENKPNNSVSIYFDKKDHDNIVSGLHDLGFDIRKETASKVKFEDKNKWWKRNSIVIYKHDNGIWELEGKNKFVKNFEKYIVKYVRY